MDHIHGYLTTTAAITTQWFFFAGTINGAIAAWISNRSETWRDKATDDSAGARFFRTVMWIMCACNAGMVALYTITPLYYLFCHQLYDAKGDAESSFLFVTLTLWSGISLILALISLCVAYLWGSNARRARRYVATPANAPGAQR